MRDGKSGDAELLVAMACWTSTRTFTHTAARVRRLAALCRRLALIAACLTDAPGLAQPPAPPETAADAARREAAPQEGADVADELAAPQAAHHVLGSWAEALARLWERSPRVAYAAADVAQARGRRRVALADLLPRLDARGAYQRELITSEVVLGADAVTVPAPNVWSAGASLEAAVVDVGAWHDLQSAGRAVTAARQDLHALRRELALELAVQLLTAWTAERLAAQHRAGLRAARQRLLLTTRQYELGRATVLDVNRAEQDVESSRASVLAGDDALSRSQQALGRLLGWAAPAAAPALAEPEGLLSTLMQSCRPHAELEQHPAVRAARTRVALAQRAVDRLDLSLLPRLGLQAQLQWNSQTVYGPPTTLQVGALLSVPIWDGGARYGRREQAHAELTRARRALDEARVQAGAGAMQAGRAAALARRALDIAARQRALARSIDERTRSAFQQGRATSLDLVSAARDLRQAELEVTVRRSELVQAQSEVLLANAHCR